jgi:hypothetical protein
MQNPNIHKLLSVAKSLNRVDESSWTCYCPVHESGGGTHNNSLSVHASDDGKILVNCHNGCDPKEVVYAFGMTWKECFPPKEPTAAGSKITAVYDYKDEDGILRFQVCRIEPGKEGRPKDFRQRQPDGAGGFTWKTKGLVKFPYRLTELAGEKDKPVWIVEGEKQVDYLRSIGLTATCNPGGAGKWLKSYAKYFDGRDVIVVPDADLPNEKTGKIVGAAHAKEVADSLIGVAKTIHVLELPGCEPKWGLDDWLQKGGHTLQELAEIGRSTPEWGPDSQLIIEVKTPETEEDMADPVANDRRILADCGITYVAQHDAGGGIEIFSDVTQKFSMISANRLGALKYEELILFGGARIVQKVKRNSDDTGDYTINQVRIAIAMIAAQNSAFEEKHGVGVWENNECLIVVNARRLGILNGKPQLQITSSPVHFGTAYNIGDRCEWIDLQKLQTDIVSVNAEPGKLHHDDIFAVRGLFAKWQFLARENVFPEVLTGLVLATFVQTLWSWRPQVFLTGQAYAGKSTMFKMLARLFGPLCKMSSNSSAAGIRQYIGASSRIVLCDELEKSRYRNEILEMVRASGRGDDSFRGTAGNQQHIAFKLQHIFWCASIESGLTTEADQSRFIVCELKKVDAKMELPSHDELGEIGQRLAAVAICNFRRARKMAEHLLENKPKGVHGRVCESYAVPISMYCASIGMSDSDGLEMYHQALAAISASEEIESDSDALLQEIMLSQVNLRGGEKKSVLHMLRDRITANHTEELEHVGIYVTDDELLLNRGLILRYLLPIDWKGKRIDTLLNRLPGARRVKKKFGGTSMRFVAIPKTSVTDVEIDATEEPSFAEQAQNPFSSLG